MIKISISTMALLLFVCFIALAPSSASAENYKLKPGDSVSISVWEEPELSVNISVLPDGTISMPLAGVVEVGGASIVEAEKKISSALTDYIAEPIVNVIVNATSGNLYYIIGKVKAPGAFSMASETNILQALSRAGGFDRFADKGEVKIMRTRESRVEIIEFDYDEASSGNEANTKIPFLKTGDVIVVP